MMAKKKVEPEKNEIVAAVTPKQDKKCYRCRRVGHLANQCSIKPKECFSCGREGHIARFCPNKFGRQRVEKRQQPRYQPYNKVQKPKERVNQVEKVEWINDVGGGDEVACKLDGVKISWLVDSESSVDVITETAFQLIEARNGLINLKPATREFRTYASIKPLRVKGYFNGNIEHNKMQRTSRVHVVPDGRYCLMGSETAKKLNILKIENNVSEK